MAAVQKNDWKRALIRPETTLQQAIRNLEETSFQIALVVASDGQLIGTLTDGDIRRGLLRGVNLQGSIEGIVQRTPLVVPPQMGRDTVLQLMQANKILQLPVVDESRRVVGLHLWDELLAPRQRPNVMVIMAGGQGTRLRPHTENCPKPMLPVAGKPMLEHIIERAKSEGVERFILAIHYLGHMIEEYFGDGSRWDIQIEYLRESRPLGTAGALSLMASLPDAPVLVSNGDILTDIHYGEILDFHSYHDAAATMAVRLHEWQHPFGVVKLDGVKIVGFEEKPVSRTHINAGIYVLDPLALKSLVKDEHCDMPMLFARLSAEGRSIVAYPMYEPWLDVGRPDDLAAARKKGAND
ncbi:MAG: nucleotidyltransferase family protein [Aquabacterium sp.]